MSHYVAQSAGSRKAVSITAQEHIVALIVVPDLTKLPDNEVKKSCPKDKQERYLPGKNKLIYRKFDGSYPVERKRQNEATNEISNQRKRKLKLLHY